MISRKALLPLVLSLACFGMTGASAEETHKEPCVGTGSATLSQGIAFVPDFRFGVGFQFTFNCITGGSVTGMGTLDRASCGQSYGSGAFSSGKPFSVITAGSMLIIYSKNGTYGIGNATPIPDTSTIPFGNSCSSGTARNFTLAGFVCAVDNPDITGCPDLPVNVIPPASSLGDPVGFIRELICRTLRHLQNISPEPLKSVIKAIADELGCAP